MKWTARAVLVSIVVLMYAGVFVQDYPAKGLDFGCYYVAARLVMHHYPLYTEFERNGKHAPQLTEDETILWQQCDTHCVTTDLPFLYGYPPFFLALIIPFAWLPFGAALLLWMLVSTAFVWLAAHHLASATARFLRKGAYLQWVVWLALVANAPVTNGIKLGNASVLFAVLTGFTLACVLESRSKLAGAFVALGAAIKISPVLQLLSFSGRSWKRAAIGFVAAAAACASLSVMIVGTAQNVTYVRKVLPALQRRVPLKGNISSIAVATRLTSESDHWGKTVTSRRLQSRVQKLALALLAITLACAWRARRLGSPRSTVLGFAALSCGGVFLSPVTWWHHYALVLPPAVLMVVCLAFWGRLEGYAASLVALAGLCLINFPSIASKLHYTGDWYGADRLLGCVLIWVAACAAMIALKPEPCEEALVIAREPTDVYSLDEAEPVEVAV